MPEETLDLNIDKPLDHDLNETIILDEEGNPLEFIDAPSSFSITYDNTSTDSILNQILENQSTFNIEQIKILENNNKSNIDFINNLKMNNSLLLIVIFILLIINFKEYVRGWLND